MSPCIRRFLRDCLALILPGCAILAFGLYHIHSFSGVTEGGVLGATLLCQHWLGLSPALSGLVMNAVCYLIGIRTLGRRLLGYSLVAGLAFSLFYAVFEQFPPLWPNLSEHQLVAALAGALFVGVGVGLCVRTDAAPTSDDALALSLSQLLRCRIQWVYLASDLLILLLSLSYIPYQKILYSLLTVILSGQLIGLIQRASWPISRNGASPCSTASSSPS